MWGICGEEEKDYRDTHPEHPPCMWLTTGSVQLPTGVVDVNKVVGCKNVWLQMWSCRIELKNHTTTLVELDWYSTCLTFQQFDGNCDTDWGLHALWVWNGSLHYTFAHFPKASLSQPLLHNHMTRRNLPLVSSWPTNRGPTDPPAATSVGFEHGVLIATSLLPSGRKTVWLMVVVFQTVQVRS